jgi:protein O-mannosyl-transferase
VCAAVTSGAVRIYSPAGSRVLAILNVDPRTETESYHRFLTADSRLRSILLGLLLVIPTVAIYYPVHTHAFSRLDDYMYVVDNAHVHDGLSWKTVVWAFTALNMANWIPLSWLSHALDYQIFGLNPAGHHLVNVALHALDVVLLFWVLKGATGSAARSFIVAVLFALHPMNVEPVAWVAERKTMLSVAFSLLALEAYRRYARELRPGTLRWVVVLFALGLMAKPQVITLPFVLLLWDYWPLQRMFPASESSFVPPETYPAQSFAQLVKEKVPLLFVCGMGILITLATQGTARPQYQPPLALRLGNAIVSYVTYIGKAFWPTAMAPEYPYPSNLQTWQVLGALLLLLVITALVLAARRYRYLVVGWFWFLGTLVPTIGLVQVGQQAMADRYTYGSYLGLFMMVCWGIADWAKERRVSVAWLASASAVVLLALSTVTYRQIGYWRDEITIWSHASRVVRGHWLAEQNLGAELSREGKMEQARTHFLAAIAIKPDDTKAMIGAAYCEQKLGNSRDAISQYTQALRDYNLSDEDRKAVLLNMALAYRDLGDTANAQRYLEQAILLGGQSK